MGQEYIYRWDHIMRTLGIQEFSLVLRFFSCLGIPTGSKVPLDPTIPYRSLVQGPRDILEVRESKKAGSPQEEEE